MAPLCHGVLGSTNSIASIAWFFQKDLSLHSNVTSHTVYTGNFSSPLRMRKMFSKTLANLLLFLTENVWMETYHLAIQCDLLLFIQYMKRGVWMVLKSRVIATAHLQPGCGTTAPVNYWVVFTTRWRTLWL
jgi:hypothetical protein